MAGVEQLVLQLQCCGLREKSLNSGIKYVPKWLFYTIFPRGNQLILHGNLVGWRL